MGVNCNDDIFVMTNMCVNKSPCGHPKLSHGWKQIEGKLKQIAVNRYGDNIWGVSSNDDIYCKNKPEDAWCHVPGKLKQVDVGDIG